ncbi:ChaN family lipoprotein [Arcobacter sp. LA11]|uniref:ChaN family lipoprotein n=1 Tax=Arcobacter sp. LA11 TaxID=1898176 RepID=UPI000932B316|nr:ChaN family lipoprotein [Arcobacter sp. LA11]
MIKIITLVLGFIFIFAGCSSKDRVLTHDLEKKEMIYSIKQAKEIDMKEIINQIEPYSLVFVGDHHNTEKTHKFFQDLLTKMDQEGYNLYLINEWFTPEHDDLLEMFTSGKIDSLELKKKREWDKFTKYKWEYVEPLYKAVKENTGKLYGMNLTKEQRTKISLKQLDKMSEDEKKFYNSLDLKVSAHSKLVMPYLKHCNKMPKKSEEACEERMYRVQVAWDTYMSENINKIVKQVIKSSKDKVFVFVGAMHIEQDLGIPLRFSRLNTLPFTTISNKKIDKKEDLEVEINKADIVYIYE